MEILKEMKMENKNVEFARKFMADIKKLGVRDDVLRRRLENHIRQLKHTDYDQYITVLFMLVRVMDFTIKEQKDAK